MCVGLVFCWAPAPFSCCFAVVFCGETQIWLGDLRVVCFCLFSSLLIAFLSLIVQLEPLRFSRLALIRFCFIPITGPSLGATSAKPGKKRASPMPGSFLLFPPVVFAFCRRLSHRALPPSCFFVFGLLPFSFFAYFCLFRCSFCLSPLVCFAPSSYGLVSCGGMVEHPPYVGRCGSRVASQYPPVRSLLLICLLSRRAWSSFCGIARYGAWYLCQAACTHGFGPVWGSLSTPCGVSWCPLLMTLQRWSVHGLCMVCTYIDPIITLSLATAANPSVLPCKHSLALVPY